MNKPKHYYRMVHDWLNKHYGKANKCENESCKNKSKVFEYCLRKGQEHARDISKYIKLCRSCHRSYDLTDEKIKKLSIHIAGKYNENLKKGSLSRKVKVLIIEDNLIFNSGKEVADYLGCNKSSVYKVLNGNRKTICGKHLKSIQQNDTRTN